LGSDGIIYMVPHNADKIGVLNPATQTFSIMDSTISGTDKYYGGVLGPDGIIYMVPFRANNIGVLNPATRTFTTIAIAWGQVLRRSAGTRRDRVLCPCICQQYWRAQPGHADLWYH
jgi:streptogramin lyase